MPYVLFLFLRLFLKNLQKYPLKTCIQITSRGFSCDFLFPLQPTCPPIPTNPPPPDHPTPASLISVHFGSISGPFWLRLFPFRVRFGSVSGPCWALFGVLGAAGVGSGRGASVREKNKLPRLFCASGGAKTRSYLAKSRFPFFYRVFSLRRQKRVFSAHESWHFLAVLDVSK